MLQQLRQSLSVHGRACAAAETPLSGGSRPTLLDLIRVYRQVRGCVFYGMRVASAVVCPFPFLEAAQRESDFSLKSRDYLAGRQTCTIVIF